MTIQFHEVGTECEPVATIDGFTGRAADIVACAAALGPFPESHNAYPGRRRTITASDHDAFGYVSFCLRRVGPVLARAFGGRRFRCLEASFSLVTTAPADLRQPQRVPHFDALDPDYIAILHYLAPCEGTAFYRQRSTGIARLTAENHSRYREGLDRDEDAVGYIAGSSASYEEIGRVTGVHDRVAIYRGALLHSGLITDATAMSDDPAVGRLTANIFVQLT